MKGDLHSVRILRRGDAPEAAKDKLGRIPLGLQPRGFGRGPDSAERLAHAASAATSNINQATMISQFMEEIPSFDRVENISGKPSPSWNGERAAWTGLSG